MQVRCMTIVHKVADQDSVLLTIAYSNLRPVNPMIPESDAPPTASKHICPLRFPRISHEWLNQFILGWGVMTRHAKTEVNKSNFDPVGLAYASL